MAEKIFQRAVLTNDDGINAPGLKILEQAAREVAHEVWVIAPEHDLSGASASLTLQTPLRIREIEERKFAVSGTPCDSVIMAMKHLMKDMPPDIVMSGVNRGINLSDDILFSGTTNAALTATFVGARAIAFSQAYHDIHNLPWETPLVWIPRVLQTLLKQNWKKDVCINVNFPDVEPNEVNGMEIVRQGRGSLLALEVDSRLDKRATPYFWFGFAMDRHNQVKDSDTDVAAIRRKAISLTPIQLDRTDYRALQEMQFVE